MGYISSIIILFKALISTTIENRKNGGKRLGRIGTRRRSV